MADRYLVATGNWSSTSVWSTASGGSAGASVPGVNDNVYIDTAHTVTLTADAACTSLGHSAGTLKLNGHKLTVGYGNSGSGSFQSFGTTARTLDLTDGTLHVFASGGDIALDPTLFMLTGSSLTLTSTGSLVIIDCANGETDFKSRFWTLGKTFNDVIINLGLNAEGSVVSNSVILDFTGSSTFHSLIVQSKNSAAHTVNFEPSATITTRALVAIGSSSSNKLTLQQGDEANYFEFDDDGSCYGQDVDMQIANNTDFNAYIGPNSTQMSGGGWLTQDPPKISTLVDPLTTDPGSNSNWTVSGTVTKVTTGHDGGGYKLADGAQLNSTETYDFVNSEFVIQLLGGTGNLIAELMRIATGGSLGSDYIDIYSLGASDMEIDTQYGNGENWEPLDISTLGYLSLKINNDGSLAAKYSEDGLSWTTLSNSVTYTPDEMFLLRAVRLSPRADSGDATIGSINPNFNQPPTATLTSPANNTNLSTTTPTLTFSATDAEDEDVTYQVQISTDNSFATTHEDALSASDDGFSGTDPYDSGSSVTYTVQSALTEGGIDYYWRVRAKDPSGSDSWGAWTTARKMTTAAIAPTVTSGSSSSVTTNSATAGGNVTSDGGASITQRGIVFGTSSNPTTSGNKVTASGMIGSFTANLTGLSSNTTYHWRAYAINSKGTSYGTDKTFTTEPKPPVLSTGTASGASTTGITVTGSAITSNPDSQTINEYGVVYNTSSSPTIANSHQTSSDGTSDFDNALSGLTENTTYYIRAYAKWRGTDYAYGSQISYKTQGRPGITLDSPSDGGTVDSIRPNLKFTGTDADNNTITYQLQLSASDSFTSPLLDKSSATDSGFSNLSAAKTDPFYSGNQVQFATPSDLTRGETYYWRVRGKDPDGSNTFGDWTTAKSFTVSAVVPTLTTVGAHDIDSDGAEIDASITADGGADITERGVAYGTSTNPTVDDNKIEFDDSDDSTPDDYTIEITGLSGSTTYYARAYAINSAGTAYGNNITFQTEQTPSAPTVVTGAAANTSDITSEFNDNEVTLDGTETVTERGVVFSDSNTTPDTDDRKIVAPSAGLGTYDLKMTGLDESTTYYVRAYAVNSIGTGYGEVVTFTTEAPFVPDEGDGYWSWSPGQSQATIGRTQATPTHASVNLALEDLGLENGKDYTFYFGSIDYDNGSPSVTIERYDGDTLITDTITAGTAKTFAYNTDYIHWNIRLFVTGDSSEDDDITAVFNDLYLAQESSFSGFVPFVPRGVNEVKIINNYILDPQSNGVDNRQDVISSIFDQVSGISWYPFNINTEGLGYFEIGDRFTIKDSDNNEKSVVVWNSSLTVDGGIKENLYTNKPDLTDTDYTKAGNSKLGGNIKNTQLQVDKQGQTIDSLVADMYTTDGVVNSLFSEVEQEVDSVITTVQGAGGVNLIKNSVMFAFDDSGAPDSWDVDESGSSSGSSAGTIIIQASPESRAAGAISGNAFTLSDTAVIQTVTVRKDADFIDEDDKLYYSISARVKKNTVGSAYIKLTNRNETLTIDLPDQTSYFWDVVSLEAILPKDDHYDIEIYSDADAGLQVTDLILAPGKTRHEWTQANGETMNSSVAISEDGITIRSSALQNNYTKIDALGFEVHKQDAGGDRIFGFNDDETNVSKLKADNQIGMPPMRLVPIDFDTYSGWAFTPSKEDD